MPIVISPNKLYAKNDDGTGYLSANVISDQTTEEQCERIEDFGDDEVARIQSKADEVTAQLANAAEVEDMFAGTFNTSTAYTTGQYVIQTITSGGSSVNKLFRFTANHPAGNWIGTDIVEVKLGNDVSDLKSALSEETRNIWPLSRNYSGKGNYNNEGVFYLTLPAAMPAGTYTISAKFVSDDTFSNKCMIAIFNTGESWAASARLAADSVIRDKRTSFTFTTSAAWSRLEFCASNSVTNSNGDTVTISDIQLETGSTATHYIPPISATDFEARNHMPLQSTNDTTDRTNDIVEELNKYGYCRLGKGDFYTSGITMPEKTRMSGDCAGSRLFLTSGVNGPAVIMGAACQIEDLTIMGNATSITPDGTITDRSGIKCSGSTNLCGTVRNCRIVNFTGAGILMQDTTTAVDKGLMISDCYITLNNAGIYIKKNSEFNKIVNCTITNNYYGVLNRGGNNDIANSGIDSNTVNVQIDQDEGTNGGHGSIVGCTLNHAGGNTGYSLIIKDTGRMLVSGCNFYYGKILMQNTNGNIIDGCGFGQGTPIYIQNSGANIICDCIARTKADTSITISEDTIETKIYDFYSRDGELLYGASVGEVNKKVDTLTVISNNLWDAKQKYVVEASEDGDGSLYIPFDKPFPAGTYTLTMSVVTDNTSQDYSYVGLYDSDFLAGYTVAHKVGDTLWFSHNKRNSVTFTVAASFQRIKVMAGDTEIHSEGSYLKIFDIQLESGNKATSFRPNATSIDARLDSVDENEIAVYTDFKAGYIDTSGTSVDINTVVARDNVYHTVIECQPDDEFVFECIGGYATRRRFAFCDENGVILYKAGTTSEEADEWITFNRDGYWIAPPGTKYLVVNHVWKYAAYYPKVYKRSKNELTNRNSYLLPHNQKPEWKQYVIAVFGKMIATLKDGIVKLSKDCGRTWNTGVDVSEAGTIYRAYLFANGTINLFAGAHIYYIEDWESYHEADYYEADGTAYVPPVNGENFWTTWVYSQRKYVNGKDMYVFGNYHYADDQRSLVWYTTDYGKTYKVAFEFGSRETTTPEGSWQIRHVHTVFYYQPDDAYIVTTGDTNATECMIFIMRYDVENDTWSCEKIAGSDRDYKWTSIGVWNGEIYYTNDNAYGSVWKCKYEDIADLTKHECVLSGMYNDADCVIFGLNGEMIVTQGSVRNLAGQDLPSPYENREAHRIFYYSSDRKTFHELQFPVTFLRGECGMSLYLPVAADGQVYGYANNGEKKVSVCISDLVREAGFKKAFMPRI